MSRVIWIDASAGASGDMFLGALVGTGVPIGTLQAAVDAIAPEPVTLSVEQVTRNGFAATRCHVEVADETSHRTWRDINVLLGRAELDEQVRSLALRVFERLAVAEATVHGSDPLDVSFHEVGALDAIADVVGACAGFVWLFQGFETLAERAPQPAVLAERAPQPPGHPQPPVEVVVSPVAVGSGSIEGAHGTMPVPPPAVAEMLRGVPSYAGPGASESCTPTGAALLTTLATSWGAQPAMTTEVIGIGAGGRDPESHANVLRLFVGAAIDAGQDLPPLLIETNIDDLDPRVWPAVIAALLDAGASDAWLTPILMKKGRPAHTLSVLVGAAQAGQVRSAIFRHTSTIGLREQPLREQEWGKHALEREMAQVEVDGQPIAVKLAREDGVLVNAQPEYDDVARAALALGRPVSEVLADAIGQSRAFFKG